MGLCMRAGMSCTVAFKCAILFNTITATFVHKSSTKDSHISRQAATSLGGDA